MTGPGQRCEGNASCIPICPSRAKYTALKTIQQLLDLSSLPGISIQVITKAVATDLQVDASGRVTHINYLKYEDENLPYATRHRAIGRRFVLAASAIENAKLLLALADALWANKRYDEAWDVIERQAYARFPGEAEVQAARKKYQGLMKTVPAKPK